jgi:hypothetical protein
LAVVMRRFEGGAQLWFYASSKTTGESTWKAI